MNSIRMRLVWSVSAVLLIPSLFLPATAEERANWPQFLGPRGRAIQETADPPENLDLTHGVGWKIKIPTGHSSPCIWGNSIFLTAFQSEPPELETMCIDRMTGEIRWQKACGDVQQIEKVHEVSNPAAPTPVTDGETVVVYFGSYGLVAYDFDGNEIWKRPLPIARAGSFGSGSSPIIAGDQVIIWVPQNRESYLGAYRLTDGKELWKAQRVQSNRTWATPILWHAGESSRVGLLASGKFTAFDAASGEEVWWVNEVATNFGEHAESRRAAAADHFCRHSGR
jgi:outer membrane protein assembly factor BamB